MYKRYIKRIIDFTLSVITFIAILPIFLIIIILVRIRIGTPVFFSQERSTLNGKKFNLMKFRTMTEEKDSEGRYLPDEIRLTKFGNILRGTSLDELPELIAIIKGDLSIIGPRPMPIEYDDYYTKKERKRFGVRGGLIPPEVLYGNVQPTWDEQLGYESDYAENVTFIMDIKILISVIKGLIIRYHSDYGEYRRMPLNELRRSEKEAENDYINTST